jgi:hypothetical protein
MESLMHPILAALAAALVLAAIPAATAQPAKPSFALPPESIVVTTTKPSDAAIRNFIEARAAPTAFLNQLAQWRRPICPATVGLAKNYTTFVSQRIRDVASAVGAPVNADPGCRPNVEVVFTTTPQELMDHVRKSGPAFLGYYSNLSQADDLAKFTHPIQAWYMTESRDYNGNTIVDRGRCTGTDPSQNTLPVSLDGASQDSNMQGGQGVFTLNLPCAKFMSSSGWRLKSGFESGIFNILVVAEPAKLLEYEVGTLADYVAMLVLSQAGSLDTCQDMPSISNLLVKGCTSSANKITDADLAYLRGLYSLPTGYTLTTQRSGIGFQMRKVLVTDKGG